MSSGLDEHRILPVNGSLQDVRILSADPHLPVMLFLHGGPGFPNRHEVLSACRPLLSHATLVCYDQRGAGRSYCGDGEPLSLSLLCDDAIAIAQYLKSRFPASPIVLAGHSFGSLLAILILQREPRLFSGLVASGLLTDVAETEMACYRFVTEEAVRRRDCRAKRKLSALRPPVDGTYRQLADMQTVAAYVRRYGGDRCGKRAGLLLSAVLPLLRSREYALRDLCRYRRGSLYSITELWSEIAPISLSRTVCALPVPLLVTAGRYDRNTPAEASRGWYDAVRAPRKDWIMFERSAHAPYVEEPALWCRTVYERMLRSLVPSSDGGKEE